MQFIITGCGRSGTNYLADRLIDAGIKCGHESVFQHTGPVENDRAFVGDSSWFAAPFLGNNYKSAKVIHVVRDPIKVIESFHRIGLCAQNPYRHFSMGSSLWMTAIRYNINLKKIKNRYSYVKAHRSLLRRHTSCWEKGTEFERSCEYWYQWNIMIEKKAKENQLRYMRVRLEDADKEWDYIQSFLDLDIKITPGEATNKKTNYASVKPFTEPLPLKIRELATRYGYT